MLRLRRSLRFAARHSLVFAILLALLAVATRDRFVSRLVPQELQAAKSVLWITAHPDDESFFFAPSILTLVGSPFNAQGSLVCLSVGDHEGLGQTRRQELREACQVLEIASDRCVSLDSPALPDDPTVWWDADTIQQAVRPYVHEWKVDAIISFDKYGVSGHANHRALASALSACARSDPAFPPVYAIRSTTVLAKYASLLLLPFSLVQHLLTPSAKGGRDGMFLNSVSQYWRARQSFAAHQSQAVWFRSLFVSFSRYLWWIEVRRVV